MLHTIQRPFVDNCECRKASNHLYKGYNRTGKLMNIHITRFTESSVLDVIPDEPNELPAKQDPKLLVPQGGDAFTHLTPPSQKFDQNDNI